MDDVRLRISTKEEDEIESAAELYGVTVEGFVSAAVLWVVYNCAEVASSAPPGVDKQHSYVI